MKVFTALIKREVWEHKGAMVITPLVMAGVLAAFMILGILTSANVTVDDQSVVLFDSLPELMEKFEQEDEASRALGMQTFLYSQSYIFILVFMIIALRYSLSCLYDERKDRSILFWKSLPVSDTQTVLSKVVVCVLLAPLFYAVIAVVFQLFSMVFATILAWIAGNSGASIWAASHFLKVAGNTLLTVVMLGIWFLPVWGWLFLASVWAKRAPFLWAVLPLVTIMIGEAWTLNTAHFAEMIGHYLGLGGHIAGASTAAIWLASESHAVTHNGIEFSHPLQALGTPEFWYGVILAGIFVTVSIYIRRYRDEA